MVVVVTHDSAAHVGACLDSIRDGAGGLPTEVWVVDNASRDGTVDLLRTRHPDVRLLVNSRNVGFAAACNRAIRETRGDLVLLLNPDACLRPGALATLAGYLERHPRVAIVGPRLLAPDGSLPADSSATGLPPGFVQALFEYTRLHRWFPRSRHFRDYFLLDWDRSTDRAVAMVQGACFLVRRSLLDALGGLDERFFLYFEETDLCARAIAVGAEVHYVAGAAATHVGGHSMPDQRQSARHFIASLYAYHRKHYGLAEAVALWAILAPYHWLRAARLATRRIFFPEDAQLEQSLRAAVARGRAHLGLAAQAAAGRRAAARP